jgi:hypothetical protein
VMARLCAQIGLPWSDEVRMGLVEWLAAHKQHQHGIHRYAGEDFGLSAGGIRERYATYRQRFGF